ncbi:MAG: ATP-binding protein [Spirochaetes bacterium]|nr:ATP-binding protein [Spirochaetota bacterium]
MIAFEQNITLLQLLVPPLCTGVLFCGVLIYLYMFLRLRHHIYLSIVLLCLCALVFTASETMILFLGGWLADRPMGLQFHRLEQISGAYFLFSLPFFLGHLLRFEGPDRRLNRIITLCGLAAALSITAAAYAAPDWFISLTSHRATWLKYQADFARGREGPLYRLRDCLLALTMAYSMVMIGREILRRRDLRELIFPVAGMLCAIGGAVVDISFVYTGVNPDFFPDKYFSRFTLGLTFMVILFMSTVTKRFIDAAKEVERAHAILGISEERYRRLVEETNDCILSLDGDLKILSANTAALAQLSIDGSRLHETDLYELFYVEPDDKGITMQLARDRMRDFFAGRDSIYFRALLRLQGTNEPGEFAVVLEHIGTGGRSEVLMKATGCQEDAMLRYIETETMRCSIENYISAADEISKRLVVNLPRYMDRQGVVALRYGLREILFNAIEHGNLEISFDEKTETTRRGEYIRCINDRQKDGRYRGRRVHIEYSLTAERVRYKVTDEGGGFDYRKVLGRENEAAERYLYHGRGIAMAMGIFDEVRFNSVGNQVLLTKNFTGPEADKAAAGPSGALTPEGTSPS